jgi:DNA-3-methyladenine glycosylase II
VQRWLHLRKPLDYARIQRITARWQPFAGPVYFHLLLDRLELAG